MKDKLARDTLSLSGLVEFKLDSWGIWSTGSLGIGYPSMAIMPETGSAVRIAPLTDAEGLMIEGIMSSLAVSCPEARRVAILYYQRRLPHEKLSDGNMDRTNQMLNIVRDAVAAVLFPGMVDS